MFYAALHAIIFFRTKYMLVFFLHILLTALLFCILLVWKKIIQERKIIKNEMRCRNGVLKSTQTRKNKSEDKYTKPHPYIFDLLWKDVGMDEALYIYHHFYPSLFVYFLARHSYSFFHFSFLFLHFLAMFSITLWSKHYFNHNPIPLNQYWQVSM